jgi:hypothetical protein
MPSMMGPTSEAPAVSQTSRIAAASSAATKGDTRLPARFAAARSWE